MDVIVISQQKKHDDNNDNDNDNDNNNNNNERMEGWLYLIRSNRIGLQYSRKRYFVLQHHLLQSFKSVPLSKNQVSSLFFFFIRKYFYFYNINCCTSNYLCYAMVAQFGISIVTVYCFI
jgi:hypothetical protein